MQAISDERMIQYCLEKYPDIVLHHAWGETALFYNPGSKYKRGKYFLTIKKKDGANDQASSINREGVYRVNFGIGKRRFIERFGYLPRRPEAGGAIDMPVDFTELDALIPHPVYAWMGWVSILNPTQEKFDIVIKLLDETYNELVKKERN